MLLLHIKVWEALVSRRRPCAKGWVLRNWKDNLELRFPGMTSKASFSKASLKQELDGSHFITAATINPRVSKTVSGSNILFQLQTTYPGWSEAVRMDHGRCEWAVRGEITEAVTTWVRRQASEHDGLPGDQLNNYKVRWCQDKGQSGRDQCYISRKRERVYALDPTVVQKNFLPYWKCSVSTLSNVIAASRMWLLCT